MADESIIVEQPVLDYETVDIIANDDTAQIEPETLDIIEVEDIQVFTVETDEAFSSLGKQNEEMKHQHFNGRDLPDQHPITAITGLRGELDSIEALQTIYSDDKQAADYYEWEDGNILLENRVGYFVSICDDIRTIKICTGEDIFGVTVDTAAFIGGQDDVARDNTYGLVAHTGIVTVRCELDVNVGDYVVPNSYGMAKKADNNYGCKVIALHNIKGVLYSAILLNMSIDQINEIGYELIDLDKRMDAAETNIVTAINIANKAYDLADDAVKTSEGASQKADDAVIKANNAMSIVDNSDKQIQEAIKLSAQAKVIADSAVVSAEAIRSEAVATANQTLVTVTKEIQTLHNEINELENNITLDVDKMEESVDNLSKDMDIVKTDIDNLKSNTDFNIDEITDNIQEIKDSADRLSNDLNTATQDIKELKDELKPLNSWPEDSENPSGIVGFVAKADENSATLAGIVEWKGNAGESLASFVTDATEENATVKSIAQYQQTDTEGNPIGEPGAAGLIAQVDANKASVELIAEVEENIAGLQAKVDKNTAAVGMITEVKDNIASLEVEVDENTSSITSLASHTIGEYKSIGTWDDETNKDIKVIYYAIDTKLYWYYDEAWKNTTKPYEAGLDGALVGIQEIADDNKAQLDAMASYDKDGKSALAGITAYVDENSANFKQLAKYNNETSGSSGIAGLVADVNDDTSALSLVANYTSEDGISGLAGLRSQVEKNKSAVTLAAENIDKNNDAIAGVKATADQNKAEIDILARFEYGNDQKIYPYTHSPKNDKGEYGGKIDTEEIGIIFTDNGDGTITVNGTATANVDFYLVQNYPSFAEGEYSISGCPDGGSETSYYIQFSKTSASNTTITHKQTNEEYRFKVVDGDKITAWIRIISGTTVNNLTFTPCFKQFYQGVAGLKNQVEKNGSSIDLLTSFASDSGSGTAGLIARVSEHDSQLSTLTTWKSQTIDSIAAIQEKSDDNEANIRLATSWQENFNLGGRNYILNSDKLSISSLSSTDGSRGEFQVMDVGQSYMDIESGTNVILSFDLEMTVNTANPTLTIYNTNYRGPKNIGYKQIKFTASVGDTIKQRCNVKTTIVDAESPNRENNYIEFYTNYGTSNWFKVSKLKLEKGNQVTDWTAAPEDDIDSIAAINVIANKNSSQISQITSWQSETEDNIAKIEQTAGENGASINMLVASIDKYSVGEYSQAYGLTQEQAKNILKEDMIYIPTKHGTNPTHKEIYSDTKEENTFTEGFYYTWNGNDWIESASGTVAFSSAKPTPNDTLRYWYINSDTAPKGYKPMTLYKADGDKWVKVNIFYNNSRNRTVTSISQEVDAISLEVADARGNIASHQQWLTANSANIQDVVSWKSDVADEVSNIATIKSTADGASASIAQVVEAVGKNGKINAASIVAAINDSGSSIVLDANHINLNGAITANHRFTIDTEGYMRTIGGSIAGWTFSSTRLGSNAKNPKYLILGDSYSVGYYVDSSGEGQFYPGGWPYQFLKKLGISTSLPSQYLYEYDGKTHQIIETDNYVILGRGGIGFTDINTQGDKYSFKQLLIDRLNKTKHPLSSFTDIIIAGGYNDHWYGSLVNGEWVMTQSGKYNGTTYEWQNFVPKGMTDFNAYLKNKGFTGKVTLFAIGDCCGDVDNYTNTEVDIRSKGLYNLYKSKSKEFGWTFVNLKGWDADDSKYYGKDNFHPNPEGLQRIATLMYNTWITGYGRLYHNPQGYGAKTRGFYLSNHPSDSWAIQIGTPDANFSDVGGNSESNHRRFLVSQEGVLWAQGAHINGTIVSTSGKIGGWTLAADRLKCENIVTKDGKQNGFAVDIAVPTEKGNTGNKTTVMAVKSVTNGTTTWPFILRSDGSLVATKLNASGGNIGGWNLSSTMLYKDIYNNGTEDKSTIRYRTFMQNINSYSNTSNRAFGVYKYTRSSTSASWDNDPQFYVNNEGYLYAKKGNFSNDITIGGTSITAGDLRKLFRAARLGYNDADSLQIRRIDATSGTIGKWGIDDTHLYSTARWGVIDNGAFKYAITYISPGTITTRLYTSETGSKYTEQGTYWHDIVRAGIEIHNSGSDLRIKNSIEDFSTIYDIFFDSLQPKRYKYNNGTSDRYHTGFIAQEVVEALKISGLTTNDFAAVCLDDKSEETGMWWLRRDEFVALNTWQIQKAKARIADLENRVAELEAIIKGE